MIILFGVLVAIAVIVAIRHRNMKQSIERYATLDTFDDDFMEYSHGHSGEHLPKMDSIELSKYMDEIDGKLIDLSQYSNTKM